MSCVAWFDHFTHTIGSGEILSEGAEILSESNPQGLNGRTLLISYIFCTLRQRSALPIWRVCLQTGRALPVDELVLPRIWNLQTHLSSFA